ncbi:MAG: Na+/H+ antiporter [Candidatus Dactylopiibacterium carminicum]|uniref:Na+/H+ antiporter n=1 Tax=Candidatus Dactylopiibacterium carminicum TaxID=857335 RepID=A0A272EZ50_9RHOO|nr:Na+/H+ antiporter [Candidatus Dactylopiibacterium carminicum]KAF7598045.1 Na+/H+ antiporter [Candidatus Dactylopiibacterium carminicum]PAS95407.1 MAG: Na+/H+ antiporter [Candidatus Dactylopiibacterium carminicum]PAS96452.1 MAG: Na+/H+ antiporter [Candidatus Dactylopiibacterium carminicum]
MNAIDITLVMFVAVVASGFITRMMPWPIPLPLVQIGLGAVIAGVFNHGIALDPEVFFLLFLPPLLFLDGWRIPKEGLLRDRFAIFQMAFGLVIFTVVGLGFLIHWMIPAMPLPIAFALAAIVSPTDPIAVSAITARIPMPKRVMHVLEGESLLNDASGLVAFRFAVAAAVTGAFSLSDAALSFLWVALAGVGVGAGFTWLMAWGKRRLLKRYGEEPGAEILVSLLIPFGAYGLAEHVGASGILAAVAAGIVMSYVELSGHALASTRIQRTVVWNTLQFTLNGIMFVLLGEQLPRIFRGAVQVVEETGHVNPWWLLFYAVVINLALAALRFVWVWGSVKVARWLASRREEAIPDPGTRLTLAVSLAGVRGAITLAGVLTLPLVLADGSPLPARDLAIFLAASVVIVSLLTASLSLPHLLRELNAPPSAESHAEEDLAREAVRPASVKAIEQRLHDLLRQHPDTDPQRYISVAEHLMQSFNLSHHGALDKDSDPALVREVIAIEADMRLAALQASRDELFRLARENEISEDACRTAVRRIDLQEARL